MKKIKSILCLGLTVFSLQLMAQQDRSGGVGNGGQGVLCNENGTEIVYLRDLWEIEHVGDGNSVKYRVDRNDLSYEDQIESAIKKVEAVSMEYADAIRYQLKFYVKNQAYRVYLEDGLRLPLTQDLGFSLDRQECRRIQVGEVRRRNYNDILHIDRDYFFKLHATDRAAFELHEAIYNLERWAFKRTTSEHTRILVGLIFSDASLTREELYRGRMQDPFTGVVPDEAHRWTKKQLLAGALPFPDRSEMIGQWRAVQRDIGEHRIILNVQSNGSVSFSKRRYLSPENDTLLNEGMYIFQTCKPGTHIVNGKFKFEECREIYSPATRGIRSRPISNLFEVYSNGSDEDFINMLKRQRHSSEVIFNSGLMGGLYLDCRILNRERTKVLCDAGGNMYYQRLALEDVIGHPGFFLEFEKIN